VLDANYRLTRREQQFIIQGAWDDFKNNGVPGIQILLNVLAESPLKDVVPNAGSFREVVGATNDITMFSDRWQWIDDPSQGIWNDWTGLSESARTARVMIPLKSRAESFSIFYIYSWSAFQIIW